MRGDPRNPLPGGIERRDIALGVAVVSGPIAWALDLQGSFSGYWVAVGWGTKGPLFVVTAASLSLCALGAYLAWRATRRVRGLPPPTPRMGFMADLALALCGLCALVIVAQAIVKLSLGLDD